MCSSKLPSGSPSRNLHTLEGVSVFSLAKGLDTVLPYLLVATARTSVCPRRTGLLELELLKPRAILHSWRYRDSELSQPFSYGIK